MLVMIAAREDLRIGCGIARGHEDIVGKAQDQLAALAQRDIAVAFAEITVGRRLRHAKGERGLGAGRHAAPEAETRREADHPVGKGHFSAREIDPVDGGGSRALCGQKKDSPQQDGRNGMGHGRLSRIALPAAGSAITLP
ncbi:hypothetical protein [Rhodovulum sp. MB263]|uniref:hypothetical protein n=1 Tax=Rhodovulum sp. (strain MB263) TaxID=308754 RepID=UPI0009B797D1|nr:hypothetical protein [Rhodovulum sp. MB263]ARC89484.1 hypothetical protein B5V46_13160 [Rhodovulum sp. MB263]